MHRLQHCNKAAFYRTMYIEQFSCVASELAIQVPVLVPRWHTVLCPQNEWCQVDTRASIWCKIDSMVSTSCQAVAMVTTSSRYHGVNLVPSWYHGIKLTSSYTMASTWCQLDNNNNNNKQLMTQHMSDNINWRIAVATSRLSEIPITKRR